MVEASMSTTPRELLDTSIAQLELLRAFLGEQLGVRTDKSESTATSDVIACQEILVSLGALIRRVQATSPESGGFRSEYRFRLSNRVQPSLAKGSA
jgi:hypothetical protein